MSLCLGGIAWLAPQDLDPRKPLRSQQAPLDIQVVSLDWKWLFHYPAQEVATVNHLVVPVGNVLADGTPAPADLHVCVFPVWAPTFSRGGWPRS